MAHIPLIHGPDGAKLSKRHGALGVEQYRALGYLPEALRNYLVRLGWSQGDKEFFSTEEMIEAFDLSAIGRSPARFDLTKLEAVNGHYIRHADDTRLLAAIDDILPHIEGGAEIAAALTDTRRAQVLKAMPGIKERARTVLELIDGAGFILANRPLAVDTKAADLLSPQARRHLSSLHARLATLEAWTAAAADAAVRAEAAVQGVKLGAIAQPLRAALTGRTTSPGIFDVLAVLGREESLARIADQKQP